MGANGENLAEPNGDGNSQQVPIQEYVEYLDVIAAKLKATGRESHLSNTTPTSGC